MRQERVLYCQSWKSPATSKPVRSKDLASSTLTTRRTSWSLVVQHRLQEKPSLAFPTVLWVKRTFRLGHRGSAIE
ncbi:hypothetical protein CONPUDRAFT_91763 [Coniophora puteana RWD-64-598 SS2]|uniref:Uncharacterized protein n=1 Tax=Coniophora puteana (strain RWD-64-598) TaxID=741705 RepID=A0A5M3MH59_CONPW|nr:uncharacterized protein CONPUDRAFT_91763 [Coniophora puteana RWD-64-598 SS2]EIW78280.1 hypothetical protein CONPUDRAFT_91763 [Coniophora puteana RWD-64-598 SS2]